eukprot:698215-Pyramimonas_sp.AAC.1
MPCAEWYTSVDSRRLSTVELKSKAFLAVDSGDWKKQLLAGRTSSWTSTFRPWAVAGGGVCPRVDTPPGGVIR